MADLNAEWQNQLLATSPRRSRAAAADRASSSGACGMPNWRASLKRTGRRILRTARIEIGSVKPRKTTVWPATPPPNCGAESVGSRGELAGALITRYAELLSKTPQRFLAVTKSDKSDNVRNDFAGYALDNFSAARALEVIAARGCWPAAGLESRLYGLAGLYFASSAPQVNAAFRDALGTANNRRTRRQACGSASPTGRRLVVLLRLALRRISGCHKQGDPEDYLPSALEATPGHADAYFTLAEYYRESASPRALWWISEMPCSWIRNAPTCMIAWR